MKNLVQLNTAESLTSLSRCSYSIVSSLLDSMSAAAPGSGREGHSCRESMGPGSARDADDDIVISDKRHSASCDNDEDALEMSRMAITALCELIENFNLSDMRPLLPRICEHSSPAFYSDINEIRAGAFKLFSQLCRFARCDPASFEMYSQRSMMSLCIHMDDSSPIVRESALHALRTLSSLIEIDAISQLLTEHVFCDTSEHFYTFSLAFSTALVCDQVMKMLNDTSWLSIKPINQLLCFDFVVIQVGNFETAFSVYLQQTLDYISRAQHFCAGGAAIFLVRLLSVAPMRHRTQVNASQCLQGILRLCSHPIFITTIIILSNY